MKNRNLFAREKSKLILFTYKNSLFISLNQSKTNGFEFERLHYELNVWDRLEPFVILLKHRIYRGQ